MSAGEALPGLPRAAAAISGSGPMPGRAAEAHHGGHGGWGLGAADLAADPPDPDLLSDAADPALWLRHRVIPWRRIGGSIVWATDDRSRLAAARAALSLPEDDALFVLTPTRAFDAAFATAFGGALALAAAAAVPPAEGVSGLDGVRHRLAAAGLAALTVLVMAGEFGLAFVLALLFVMNALTGILRFAALLAGRRREAPLLPPPPEPDEMPVVSVLVPLFREARMVPGILDALDRTRYPRDLLDVKIVVEEADIRTRAALDAAPLPPWVDVVVVPEGSPRTKPRALNYALGFCRGSVVGILDAEDHPAPDQFLRVVAALHAAAPEVACLQCQLSYYNVRENWITRCFELEYAIWFDVLLRGYQRLGLPIPLGGTSVYFRREALERLGGWDAHNVTEDADLGMRIVRAGLRCEMLDSVTEEEANCRPMPWIRQRSRWLKGYLLTFLSHMRDPARLWRDMGPRGFVGFNVIFLGGAVTYLAMPLFWLSVVGWAVTGESLWSSALPGWTIWPLGLSLAAGQAVMLGCATLAMVRRHGLDLLLWVPLLPFYWTLGALAAWKAVAELFVAPTYWDKTQHGVSRLLRNPRTAPGAPAADAGRHRG